MSKSSIPDRHGVEEPVTGTYPNQTLEQLHKRGSCRHFQDKPIPEETQKLILGAAIHAPSVGNLQAFSIIKIQDPEKREKLKKICGNERFIGEAPLNLVICIDERRNKKWANQDVAPYVHNDVLVWFLLDFQLTGIIGQSICIAADSLGIGSCYVGTATLMAAQLVELLGLPKGVFPGTLISLGYPSEPVPNRKKHRFETLVHNESYRDLSDREVLDVFHEKYSSPGASRFRITESRLDRLYKSCRRVHGEEFAEKCVSHARELGYINYAQNYYGLNYRADISLEMKNSDYCELLYKQGFNISKDIKPAK